MPKLTPIPTPDANTESHNPSSLSDAWAIVRYCNDGIANKDYTAVRQQLASYFQIAAVRPGKLHAAILSIAVKLATLCPDFHLVPFLKVWDMSNLRPEDCEAKIGEDGKRIPALEERLAKAYAYALLFHPEERLEPELEPRFLSLLHKKGFVCNTSNSAICNLQSTVTTPLLATRLIPKDVRGRKMTFVCLVDSSGSDILAEVHKLTAFQRLRYEDIPGMVFDVLLRTSEDKGTLRIEAAIPSKQPLDATFPTKIGYVEHIDLSRGHIHIYDNESRHFVAEHSRVTPSIGDYVVFTPIIPKSSNFKTALIRSVLNKQDGPAVFGFRNAKVTYTDLAKGFSSWELFPDEAAIVETGTSAPTFTKGYIHQSIACTLGTTLPTAGQSIRLICFLKRSKDGQKRPHTVYYE